MHIVAGLDAFADIFWFASAAVVIGVVGFVLLFGTD